MTDDLLRAGGCLCGAVRFTARLASAEAGACHCDMCGRWTSGPFHAIRPVEVTWEGAAPTVFASSAWAERGFCGTCGSPLFYRVTAPGPYQGEAHLSLGALDDRSGPAPSTEVFVDRAPATHALHPGTKKLTEADVMAMVAAAAPPAEGGAGG